VTSSIPLEANSGARSVMKDTDAASVENKHDKKAINGQVAKALREALGLLRGPQRVFPLIKKLVSDKIRVTFEQRHLYSHTRTKRASAEVLRSSLTWILNAQRPDGGIAAYYSLLSGYSKSYPEVTGYIIPTLYDFARAAGRDDVVTAAQRATLWLLSLQMPTGAFPGGFSGEMHPSVFNTAQILQGMVRAHREMNRSVIRDAAFAAGDWLVERQHADGSWRGSEVYQHSPHTYYSMVSWALAELSEHTATPRYARAADKNLDWVLPHFQSNGWINGINLRGHPKYLHFIAYVLQGVLECAILRRRSDAIEAVEKSAWVLLRKFETNKFLAGAYESDFKNGRHFACLTGNAQMSCVWLRLFELTGDLRYLNTALKINELLKQLISASGPLGIAGGVSGSYPVWGRYQPLRYISCGMQISRGCSLAGTAADRIV
jgi:hypothetical protein